ncbi:MAG: penicillin-binding protein 2 [Cyanobacteria bacterium]|nr:penicillin-binding protein 2 [Cyanobacteriota bacterium]
MLNKSNILYYFTIALLGFLGLRLFQLQILDYQKYKTLAKNNTSRTAITRAPRGIIYDRHGEILATSKQSLSVIVFPAALQDKEAVAKILSNFIEIDYQELLDIFLKMDPSTPLPITLDNDISIESAIKIYENQNYLPGIAVEKQATRYYPHKEIAAHVLGYVGQINSQELKEARSRGLGLGDIVGKEGLEKVFDQELQGTKGEARVVVDRYGKSLITDSRDKRVIKPAIKGENLHLTIDIGLQKIAIEALEGKQGAAVAINPRNGEIYCLVSSPSFDPNIFTKPVPFKLYQSLLNSKAFLNKAISAYTPGSIWKPITAIAALEHGVVNINEYLKVGGSINYAGFQFGDWTSKEGQMNLIDALEWSRNTYFYQIAKRMKAEWISNIGSKFGAGQVTGIELLGESQGILPSPEWKKKKLKEQWFPGNTLHFAIGQSFLMLSPIQAARLISGIANKGLLPQPHLIKNKDKEVLLDIDGISEESYNIVEMGLKKCITTGTGQASRLKEIEVAGKTGSAEVRGYDHSTHGWFAAYAPAKDPEIAIVVFLEGGGHGGTVAAPVAKKIFEAYFSKPSSK